MGQVLHNGQPSMKSHNSYLSYRLHHSTGPLSGPGRSRIREGGLNLQLRFRLVLISAAYVTCLIYAYNYYLSPIWAYMGYPVFDVTRSGIALFISILSILSLALLLPPRIMRYSHFVVWFLFFFLFAPILVVVSMQGLENDGGIKLVTILTISYALIYFIPEVIWISKLHSISSNVSTIVQIPARININIILIVIYILFTLSLLINFFHMMKVVGFYEVYEQRELAIEISGNRTLIAYLAGWLTRVIAPIMIAIGLMYKRKIYIVLGLFALLVSYAIFATKYLPALILLMILLHYFVLDHKQILAERIGLIALGGILLPLGIITLYGYTINGTIDILVSQSLRRVFGNPGMIIGFYSEFFDSHNLTYFTHLGPIRWFFDYPYNELTIGQVVGFYTAGTTAYNANANFWATDGIAALGHIGVVLIGVVLGLILTVFNYWSSPTALRLLCLSSVSTVWMLTDTSVFRALFTGGWPIFFLIAHYFFERSPSKRSAPYNKQKQEL